MLDTSLKSLRGGLSKSQSLTSLATSKRNVEPATRPGAMLKNQNVIHLNRHPLKKLAHANLPDKYKKLID
jgi:hypothetical protein